MRCIKPNDTAEPAHFVGSKVLSQLRSNGVLGACSLNFLIYFAYFCSETVKLRRAGYANRMPLDIFHGRYAPLGLQYADPFAIKEFLKGYFNVFYRFLWSDL